MESVNNVRLIACPNLALEHGRIDRYVPEGATVDGHLRALGWHPETLNARVFIDGIYIEQAQWEYAVPRAGQSFVTRVIPMGGDQGGKSALRIVAMLAVVVASIITAGGGLAGLSGYLGGAGAWAGMVGGSTGALVTAAGISIIGSLRTNSLLPVRRL